MLHVSSETHTHDITQNVARENKIKFIKIKVATGQVGKVKTKSYLTKGLKVKVGDMT